MVVNCDIEFEQNLTGTYYAGQVVSGTIVLKCDKPKEVQAILLKISGTAETAWTERRFNTRTTYYGREDYLSSNTYLMGSEQITLATGVHTYTFACQLPSNCPSSFEGMHGHIRYTIKVSLVRPWKFDQNYKKAFTVLRITDLNFESPQIRIPASSEAYRTFCCGPCTTEPLKLELKVPQTGFVPGQNIPVQGLIINNTNMAVSEVKFSLVMLVRYTSTNPKRINVQRISVSKVKGDSVLRYCTRCIKEELHVPATPPTCIQSCNVIQIVYQVEMYVEMKSLFKSQVISMPVIIGNVPLANNTRGSFVIDEQPSPSRDFSERPTSLDLTKGATAPPTLYLNTPNMPPPSYEESVHTQRNNINEGEENSLGYIEFTPLYPVFKVPSPSLEESPTRMGVDNNSFTP
ncbi:arrestin domain-containing protein 17-like isoform X2 [Haematobia irritans]|uniref:arrestin domain-containing protein 17-like isoform X2 n=1 Tax=Haematobia irritans TaxID=7368 RepID=UPI003F506F3B